jgi:nitrous oxide reductase accessory protein NosL
MKRLTLMIFSLALLCAGTLAFSQEDITAHRFCAYCGMDRKAYGFSRMLIHYEDGSAAGVCSLHCAVIELNANQNRAVKALLVADRDNRDLVDAVKATWVIGGSKRGVMTQRPKWAFRTKAAAEAFIKDYGGAIVSWAEALASAREEVTREAR